MGKHLNEDQAKLLNEVLIPFFTNQGDWRFSNAVVISAPAGTGKTFLMNRLINALPQIDFTLCATTHKAAEQLSVQTGGRYVKTVHSLYKIKVCSNYNTGKNELDFRNATIQTCKCIICDECSMIDWKLYDYIMKHSFCCKFLFIGDDKQLPPVMCRLSPVFTEIKQQYTLTKLMRQNGNKELEAICSIYRGTVDSHVFPKLKVSGSINLLSKEDFDSKIEEYFAQPTLTSKILCYTNKKVVDYSRQIADIRHEIDFLKVGNNYLINNALVREKPDSSYQKVIIQSNCELELKGLEEQEHFLAENGLRYKNVKFYSSIVGDDIWAQTAVDKDEYFNAIKAAAKAKDWRLYFKLTNSFLDLRYRDSSTVHKAQGMTLDTVFIDLTDLGKCTQTDLFARLMYVAVSRARKQIYMTGKLPEKFGSIENEE